jgi:hypothetical protein
MVVNARNTRKRTAIGEIENGKQRRMEVSFRKMRSREERGT